MNETNSNPSIRLAESAQESAENDLKELLEAYPPTLKYLKSQINKMIEAGIYDGVVGIPPAVSDGEVVTVAKKLAQEVDSLGAGVLLILKTNDLAKNPKNNLIRLANKLEALKKAADRVLAAHDALEKLRNIKPREVMYQLVTPWLVELEKDLQQFKNKLGENTLPGVDGWLNSVGVLFSEWQGLILNGEFEKQKEALVTDAQAKLIDSLNRFATSELAFFEKARSFSQSVIARLQGIKGGSFERVN